MAGTSAAGKAERESVLFSSCSGNCAGSDVQCRFLAEGSLLGEEAGESTLPLSAEEERTTSSVNSSISESVSEAGALGSGCGGAGWPFSSAPSCDAVCGGFMK